MNKLLGAALVCAFGWSLQAEELSLPEGEVRIFLANADGSQMKRLLELPKYAFEGSPAWSQDGKLIAFDAHKAGESANETHIIVVNADGTNPRDLGDGAMPSFSPQGKRIAFSRYSPNQGVWVMSTEGAEKELVLLDEAGWSAHWSPDGSRIAWSKSTGTGANMVVFDLIEGTTTMLFPEGAEPYQSLYWNHMWSPDSKQIVFRGIKSDQTIELGIIDARGSKHGLTTRLVEKTLTNNFTWTPDGKLLCSFACPEREKRIQIYQLDPRTTDAPQLLSGQNPDFAHSGIALSADGQRLAISTRRPKAKAK